MMTLDKFRLLQQYNRVALWNQFAGKTASDTRTLKNQLARVEEEIKELHGNLVKSQENGIILWKNILDDLADIFVTAGYYEYLKSDGISTKIYTFGENKKFTDIDIFEIGRVINPQNALKIICELALTPKGDNVPYDMLGAFCEVNDSNFSKFIPYGAKEWLSTSLEMLSEEHGELYTHDSSLYHVILRKSDDKVLKGVGFRPPKLDEFVKV